MAVGAIGFFIFYSAFSAIAAGYVPAGPNLLFGILAFNLSVLSFPLSISLFLALEFAYTSRSLATKLVEVQELSAKTLAQELDKQKLITAQNETLERQVVERTAEVVAQKEELHTTLEHLKATQSRLIQSEKMASLGELTAGIAHEIQNPLNFVNNFSEVSADLILDLEQEVDTDHKQEVLAIAADLRQSLQRIHLHGQRAEAIVKNMMQHSHISTGSKQAVDLNTLVEEYLRLAYYNQRAKDQNFECTFDTSLDQQLPKVVVPQELGKVLLILFNNAFYAVQQKKRISKGFIPKVKTSTRLMEGKVEIVVWDNGTGIPFNVKSKIFQPFFTTKPTGHGTGLGLSLSYEFITRGYDGGELIVVTEEGEWTEFTIKLPKVTLAEELTSTGSAPAEAL
ncbi:sensor histidine kinase [Pontibacter brevis]